MRYIVLGAALWLGACELKAAPVTEYVGGQWWTGTDFVSDTRYVRDGEFVDPLSHAAETRVSLAGRFMIPPLADAHLHNLSGTQSTFATLSELRRDGIVYAVSLGDSAKGRRASLACERHTGSADIVRSNGMITSPGGHPVMNYEAQALGKQGWSLTDDDREMIAEAPVFAQDVYWTAQSAADIRAMEAAYIAQQPDIVKVIIFGDRGVDDETLHAVVSMAARHDRRVFAHINDAKDLERAIDAGVDALAHISGYDTGAPVSKALIARLAETDIAVIPTLARQLAMEPFVPPQYRLSETDRQTLEAGHARILNDLIQAEVTVLPGFDLNGGTALDEILYWIRIGAVTAEEALMIATKNAPQHLFPDRTVGCLEIGCEASFIALTADPRQDMRRVRTAMSALIFKGAAIPTALPACDQIAL
ncbi:amidohydrolase family protein [Algimonas porphyrae]|uniref:Amidohydrolase n=1 Tax=Algimonas porphyrae TaxID=1128113 RepID=A0ABQ5V4T0_9PROT|nr:amidohydrolase family protein [Algimonas porphyrae]GLQ21734.1 amidohydrolase [Algimonas porphyrae]